ncbi:MAG: zinc ABC transporter substrate-binding protein [Clostridia bacterium]|nr:zinc ABC transporter substrate-binding protein [Clostridia bacterium]
MNCLFSVAALAEEKKPRIVATIFPIYDWVRQIAGDHLDAIDLTLLLDSGVDLHSFQPTVQDMVKITTCDLFLYVGGESDQWAEDILSDPANSSLNVLSLIDALGDDIKEEELVEGMEAEDEEEEADGEAEADEHVWLSLHNAEKLTDALCQALMAIDPARADEYLANAAAYREKLAALDAQYAEALGGAAYQTLLFGDRFPFRYLADDYGLSYYAAFSGCSAETEASFQTIVFLAQKVNELHLPAVLTIEGAAHRIAETVVSATQEKNQKILALNSMQGVTAAQAAQGITYLSIMESNLQVLLDALN